MAKITNNFRTGYAVQINYTVNSQSVTNNTSNVTVSAQLVSTGSSYRISATATKYGSLTVNGTKYDFTFNATLNGNQTKTVYTKTLDIPHNADGSKSCSMSCSLGIEVTLSGVKWNTVTASGTATFTTIPRGSTFSLSSTSVTAGSSTPLTISISRSSNNFTHKVYCNYGNSGTVTLSSSAGTSYSWTPSLDNCSNVPNSTSASGTIWIETYNGSTRIATSGTKSFTFHVPSSVVPTINSFKVLESGISGIPNHFVKGRSRASTIIDASGSRGSTISKYVTKYNGTEISYSKSTLTGLFTSSGSGTFEAIVTDTRGRTASKAVTITVYDYYPPVTSLTATRCLANGTEDNNGTYYKITYGVTDYATINGNNSISWQLKTGLRGSVNTQQATGTGTKGTTTLICGDGKVSIDSQYQVQLHTTDIYGSYVKEVDVPTAFVLVDFKNGGTGMAIGKVAELENTFEVHLPTQINKPLKASRGTWSHHAYVGTKTGYVKVCTMTITGTYANSPIALRIARRDDMFPWDLYIRFSNANSTTPNLSYFHTYSLDTLLSAYCAYLHQISPGVWDLYIEADSGYCYVDIMNIEIPKYMQSRIEIDWCEQYTEYPPDGGTYASYYGIAGFSE